ncbi:MAG: hemolysin family protein [Blautia sp.]|jgi:putative hemolysin
MIQIFVLLIVLIFLNAVFASAEIAVISTNETKLRRLAEEGDARAGRLVRLTEQPARFLATIQVAITMAGMLQSAVAAENFSGPLTDALIRAGAPIPAGVLKSICFFLITLLLAYFNLVFGELVPKRLAMKKSESMALGMSGLLYWVSKIFAPLVWLLTASTNLVLRLLGIRPEQEDEAVTEEEIRLLLMEGNEKGTILPQENEIIQNVFEFDDITVEEICTHRREVVTLSILDSEEKWEGIIAGSRHTYYPVCGESKDDVLGVLDTKDYFRAPVRTKEYLMEHAVDKACFVPESLKANVLFGQMKASRVYFAVLIDEYGILSGIVTLHDLIEALVGDLEEKEEPRKPKEIDRLEEDVWRIQGCADLEDVMREVKKTLPTDIYDTFSGYICGVIGRVPDDGEQFTCEGDGLVMEVKSVSGHIIGEVIVRAGKAER